MQLDVPRDLSAFAKTCSMSISSSVISLYESYKRNETKVTNESYNFVFPFPSFPFSIFFIDEKDFKESLAFSTMHHHELCTDLKKILLPHPLAKSLV